MDNSDRHLEDSLQDLNDRVYELESSDDVQGLLEAYVGRGSVLYMLEHTTSALEDMESACEIIDDLESQGIVVDPGIHVRIHSIIADIIFNKNFDPVEEYSIVSEYLVRLNSDSRYYDRRSIVRLCISACTNLLDSEHFEDCQIFVEKALSITEGNDPWSRNRRVDILLLSAEAKDELNDVHGAMADLSEVIEIATSLMENGSLEDEETIIIALTHRAQFEIDLGMDENSVTDLSVAIELMEAMYENHMLEDLDALINLHHDLAGVLMKIGRIEESEKHMIRAMEVGIGTTASSIRGNNPDMD